MNTPFAKSLAILSLLCALLTLLVLPVQGQTRSKDTRTVIEGTIRDSQDRPIAGALVSLDAANSGSTLTLTADAQGHFRFESVPAGAYTLHAKCEGYQEGRDGPFLLHEHESKLLVIVLAKAQSATSAEDPSNSIAFSDEPAFTVAGVTDTTALGGHGSGPVVRGSNALSKETASLAREDLNKTHAAPNGPGHGEPSRETVIRAMLAHEDNAELHAQLAEIEETKGRPLEAVRDFQRAAELQPTEPYLFAWGAELLLHHAPEPAIEVFTKGHRLFPQSSRMLLGLGAARYAQHSIEQAEQIILEACDLDPADPTPYLYLGRLQEIEKIEPPGLTARMKRFVTLHPESAMAHYLYAVALIKQDQTQENFAAIEAELNTAVALDPHLGSAYLQLGILRSDRQDYPGAIRALQKAIETTPLPEEAHYRLAQVYRRMGETEKSREEIEQFRKISEQKNQQAERERHEIPQFVYTLRNQIHSSQSPNPDPK